MDYLWYLYLVTAVMIGLMVLAGVFFALALYHVYQRDLRFLKSMALGLATLAVLSLCILGFTDSTGSRVATMDLMIATFALTLLSAVYYWLFRAEVKVRSQRFDTSNRF